MKLNWKKLMALWTVLCLMLSLFGCVMENGGTENVTTTQNAEENGQAPDGNGENVQNQNPAGEADNVQNQPSGREDQLPPDKTPLPEDGRGIAKPTFSDINAEKFYSIYTSNDVIPEVQNVLPEWIIEEYGINVFQAKDGSNVYIVYEEKYYPLYPWTNPGADGVVHICVEDINDDGYAELYLSLSYGTNALLSKIYGFDTKTHAIAESGTNYQAVNYFRYVNGVLQANDFITITKRDVRVALMQSEYTVKGECFEANVKIDINNVNFPAVFTDTHSFGYVSLLLEVNTTYIGERYVHVGSSTLYGAMPIMENAEHSYTVTAWATDDYMHIPIETGRTFEDIYPIEFFTPPEVGAYDLVLTYNGERVVIEDAVSVLVVE